MYESMVAMFGSIMPAPLAIPTTRAPPRRVRLRSFGYRSVVMIARAAVKASPPPAASSTAAAGTTSPASSSAGSRHPITPVLLGSTAAAPPANPKAAAAAAHTRSVAAAPSPPAHTFDTLLFTASAWIGAPDARRARPTVTGAPGKRLRVNTAPHTSVGTSRATRVHWILRAPMAGASTGMKRPGALPHRNPAGRVARAWR
mmetsp:Transcript_43035/g.84589  ORF Transcript_43035/g.84589 Transcript_43035/m.84589 type:complete len:201 (+) Transcript_43035:785-1387(+)